MDNYTDRDSGDENQEDFEDQPLPEGYTGGVYHIPEQDCPYCGHHTDTHTDVVEGYEHPDESRPSQPIPGDLMVCGYCMGMNVMGDNGMMRKAEPQDVDALPYEGRVKMGVYMVDMWLANMDGYYSDHLDELNVKIKHIPQPKPTKDPRTRLGESYHLTLPNGDMVFFYSVGFAVLATEEMGGMPSLSIAWNEEGEKMSKEIQEAYLRDGVIEITRRRPSRTIRSLN